MLSPQVSVTTPDGASLPTTSTRRRGLSYLRALSQNRTSTPTSPDPTRTSPRASPRSYFARSTSFNDTPSSTPPSVERRSVSRPNESIRPEINDPPNGTVNALNTTTEPQKRRAQSPPPQQDGDQTGSTAESDKPSDDMARNRTSSSKRTASANESTPRSSEGSTARVKPQEPGAQGGRQASKSSNATNTEEATETKSQLPTIRLFPHQEARSARQSLNFVPISRTLPNDTAIIKVGRYSEREGVPVTNPTGPSDAPVGFKSKVVSRKHCEFSFVNGQWHVKDVSSSSGTFLNHIRLSQPNTDSKLFPVKDGDILQLGIDFRGGEEMIFRCVKIRIECNRSWQKRANNFNKSRHAQLQNLTKDSLTDGATSNSGECAICLGSMLPYQALFVAPCAHAWHYKCIRPMLEGKNSTYPQFQCPNCRAYADLSADVDVSVDDMDEAMGEAGDDTHDEASNNDHVTVPHGTNNAMESANGQTETMSSEPAPSEEPLANGSASLTPNAAMQGSALLARRQAANQSSSELNSVNGIDMPDRFDAGEATNELRPEITRTGTPDASMTIAGEGPLTPRNNAGPFVFDGSAGRTDGRRLIASALPESSQS